MLKRIRLQFQAAQKVFTLSMLALSLRAVEPAKEILLWPNGAPGSEGKTGDEKVRIADNGEHVLSKDSQTQPRPTRHLGGLATVYLKFKQLKVLAELHTYAGSGHGFGLRANDTKPVAKWVERFEEWLADSGFLRKQ